MKNPADFTHRSRATDPAKFRAIATGVGYTQGASFRTGTEIGRAHV